MFKVRNIISEEFYKYVVWQKVFKVKFQMNVPTWDELQSAALIISPEHI